MFQIACVQKSTNSLAEDHYSTANLIQNGNCLWNNTWAPLLSNFSSRVHFDISQVIGGNERDIKLNTSSSSMSKGIHVLFCLLSKHLLASMMRKFNKQPCFENDEGVVIHSSTCQSGWKDKWHVSGWLVVSHIYKKNYCNFIYVQFLLFSGLENLVKHHSQ